MGANHQKEIEAYCQWALPTFGLINNCGKAHLEGFGGIEGVRKGKGELYDFIKKEGGTIFRNADYDYLESMSAGIENQITYGEFSGTQRGKIYEHEPFLKIAILNAGEEQLIPTNLVGDYNLPNVLAAYTVGSYFEVSPATIVQALSEYKPTNNRSEYQVRKGVHIILDAYNANPSSMKAAIHSFRNTKHANKTMMLGAMMELGEETVEEHEKVIQEALQSIWKHLVTVGKEFEKASQENGLTHFDSAEQAKEWYQKYVEQGDWVYIKGSRLTAMEKIIED
jgi:UDP-N-acetylmuramoyl-tripeptide--D-alanyl-D-alanine ligase